MNKGPFLSDASCRPCKNACAASEIHRNHSRPSPLNCWFISAAAADRMMSSESREGSGNPGLTGVGQDPHILSTPPLSLHEGDLVPVPYPCRLHGI